MRTERQYPRCSSFEIREGTAASPALLPFLDPHSSELLTRVLRTFNSKWRPWTHPRLGEYTLPTFS